MVLDQLHEVASIRRFHDDAEAGLAQLKKRLFVSDDIGVLNWGQNSYFI